MRSVILTMVSMVRVIARNMEPNGVNRAVDGSCKGQVLPNWALYQKAEWVEVTRGGFDNGVNQHRPMHFCFRSLVFHLLTYMATNTRSRMHAWHKIQCDRCVFYTNFYTTIQTTKTYCFPIAAHSSLVRFKWVLTRHVCTTCISGRNYKSNEWNKSASLCNYIESPLIFSCNCYNILAHVCVQNKIILFILEFHKVCSPLGPKHLPFHEFYAENRNKKYRKST